MNNQYAVSIRHIYTMPDETFIVFCVCTWEEVTTARTIIMRDGNQSYACTVSDISLAPHDCNPIEDAK